MNDEISGLIEKEIAAIRNIPQIDNIEQIISLLHDTVHFKGGKVVISGMGKAGQIGHNIATTFSATGTASIFLHPADAQHGDLGMIQENDVLFLISNSGKTREIIELMHLVKDLYPEIKIITLTGHPENELSKMADLSLDTGNPEEICPIGLTPTTSTTVMMVIGDILVVQLMKKINFTKEDFAKRHHSGYLGQKSRN